MAETLKEKTSKGLFWGTLNNGIQQILNLAFGIVLARLLTPDDYGMIGMVAIFSLIASALQESGFISALINKKEVTQEDYNAVFWFNVLVGGGLYILLFFCAPLIAGFFDQPELIPLSRYVFLTFVISSLGIVPRAILYRNLRNKEMAILSVSALALSGTTGIILAYNGCSYWGIATQQIVFCASGTLLCYFFTKWHPNWKINFEPLKGMIGFSSKMLVPNIFSHLNNNIFAIFFGKFYTQTEVGNYTQANKWNYMGYAFINNTLQGVSQPVLARVRDDKDRQKKVFRKMLRFTAFLSFPLMFGLSLVSHELIVITISDKWLMAAAFLQILCIDGAFIPIRSLYSNLIISNEKSGIYMWNTVVLCLMQLSVLLLLRSFASIRLIQIFVIVDVLYLFVWQYFVWREIGLRLFDALKDVLPFLFLAGATMVSTYFITLEIENIYLRFVTKIIIAGIIYLGSLWLLKAKILKESVDFFINKNK